MQREQRSAQESLIRPDRQWWSLWGRAPQNCCCTGPGSSSPGWPETSLVFFTLTNVEFTFLILTWLDLTVLLPKELCSHIVSAMSLHCHEDNQFVSPWSLILNSQTFRKRKQKILHIVHECRLRAWSSIILRTIHPYISFLSVLWYLESKSNLSYLLWLL